MGSIPSFLLTHSGVVEPYQGVTGSGVESFGSGVAIARCFVDEKPRVVRGNANGGPGDAKVAEMTVYAPLDLDPASVPIGSRFTHDQTGRTGIVIAVSRFDGNGLPTPDHVAISVGEVSP